MKTYLTNFLMLLVFTSCAGCAAVNRVSYDVGIGTIYPAESNRRFVLPSNLNMRACPGMDCRVVHVLRRGATVEMGEHYGHWVEILSGVWAYSGWVDSRYLGRSLREPVRIIKKESPDGAPPSLEEEWAGL